MSNCETITLPVVEVEPHQVREVLRCEGVRGFLTPCVTLTPSTHLPSGVLHTILFNRALGMVKPRNVDSELFDITYVRACELCVWPVRCLHGQLRFPTSGTMRGAGCGA